jgi:hypothetical protein
MILMFLCYVASSYYDLCVFLFIFVLFVHFCINVFSFDGLHYYHYFRIWHCNIYCFLVNFMYFNQSFLANCLILLLLLLLLPLLGFLLLLFYYHYYSDVINCLFFVICVCLFLSFTRAHFVTGPWALEFARN